MKYLVIAWLLIGQLHARPYKSSYLLSENGQVKACVGTHFISYQDFKYVLELIMNKEEFSCEEVARHFKFTCENKKGISRVYRWFATVDGCLESKQLLVDSLPICDTGDNFVHCANFVKVNSLTRFTFNLPGVPSALGKAVQVDLKNKPKKVAKTCTAKQIEGLLAQSRQIALLDMVRVQGAAIKADIVVDGKNLDDIMATGCKL